MVVKPVCKRHGPILIVATFHNPNWAVSHIVPIASASNMPVIVVTDPVNLTLNNVVFKSPGPAISKIVPRALAKFALALRLAIRERPSHIIGYHFFPSAVIALLCRSFAGGSAIYQSTGGPIEIEGGGWNSENKLLRNLQRPSKFLEKMSLDLVRHFDYVVGRGVRAEEFFTQRGKVFNYRTILGSVEIPCSVPDICSRDIDVLFVGRLAETKRLNVFLQIVKALVTKRPELCVAIIGDGEQKAYLSDLCVELGILDNVHFTGQLNNVFEWLCRSKTFVLTSRTEGVSIAMLEAMARGVVPVVIDVGELSSALRSGVSGYLIKAPSESEFCERIEDLLSNPTRWRSFSASARLNVAEIAARSTVTEQWRNLFSSQDDIKSIQLPDASRPGNELE